MPFNHRGPCFRVFAVCKLKSTTKTKAFTLHLNKTTIAETPVDLVVCGMAYKLEANYKNKWEHAKIKKKNLNAKRHRGDRGRGLHRNSVSKQEGCVCKWSVGNTRLKKRQRMKLAKDACAKILKHGFDPAGDYEYSIE
mmetsp:Transcript_8306/g.13605  ORF Transcript_8306/g.13605 Transcript_8306/m.13605 type:complete len:138 (-) Transcript_8306:121-534(-)